MKYSLVFAAAAAGLASAVPTQTIAKRADFCGQYASTVTGDYTVYNNLWGEEGADSGNGCTGVDSLSGNTVAWHATWTWKGGNGIKAYPNVVVNDDARQLSAISSIPSTWSWSYSGSSLLSDVAYDAFTSSTAGGDNEYEVMIWLASIGGAGPISSGYNADGSATVVATTTLAGQKWNLYKGPNGDTTVFSFLPAGGEQIKSFDADVFPFFQYLVDNQGLSSSQYLISFGAGTEPTTGSDAKFTVDGYSASIKA